jgi:hypothetical protein
MRLQKNHNCVIGVAEEGLLVRQPRPGRSGHIRISVKLRFGYRFLIGAGRPLPWRHGRIQMSSS